jgi:hypothetical protein
VDSLVTLRNWRRGGAASALTGAALLPFSTTSRPSFLIALATALCAGTVLALAVHFAREIRLRTLAIYPELADLPEVARRHRRLAAPRSRRALARDLRGIVASAEAPSRVAGCQVAALRDRIAVVRSELLDIAAAVEHGEDADPACLALLHALLRDGGSPLYNPNVPIAHLHQTLSRSMLGVMPAS